MRQFTTEQQTAKLIELGFERPKSISNIAMVAINNLTKIDYEIETNYSIGELIEILPQIYPKTTPPYCFEISFDTISYIVGYTYDNGYIEATSAVELVDALYNMVVKLKEEGVI